MVLRTFFYNGTVDWYEEIGNKKSSQYSLFSLINSRARIHHEKYYINRIYGHGKDCCR